MEPISGLGGSLLAGRGVSAMPDPSLYAGREQTYVKHFFLEKYLERVAYNIYSFQNDFAYVDGFSGPWKSIHENYKDTSFSLALEQLRKVRKGLQDGRGKNVTFRCLFVEKHAGAFGDLKAAIDGINDVNIELIRGEFEEHIEQVREFVARSFSLIFIDPKGWSGYPLQRITPLLQLRGEVLINFMSDFVNRFIDDPRPSIAHSFDELFGSSWFEQWKTLNDSGMTREAAAIRVYTQRLKVAGGYNYVTSTRILKPASNRAYFYLIYATRHWKGIQEFRKIEQDAIVVQERLRNDIKYQATVARTGSESLFGSNIMSMSVANYEDERKAQLNSAHALLLAMLKSNPRGIKFELLLGSVLETPLVWETDLKGWLKELRSEGKIEIQGMKSRERTPKPGYLVVPRTS